MTFLEKDLEQIIFETPNSKLKEKGLLIQGEKKRQLRIGGYGISDIVTFSRHRKPMTIFDDVQPYLFVNVFELKQNKIDANAMMQAFRYCKGIERYIHSRNKHFDISYGVTLIGKEISLGDFCYLPCFMGNLHVYTYKYTIDGMTFKKEVGYKLTNEGF